MTSFCSSRATSERAHPAAAPNWFTAASAIWNKAMEALKERGLLLQNAPHLVHDLGFVVPNYDWWEAPFYGLGLKLYQLLAGKYGFGPSRILSRDETLERLPTIKTEGLKGG